MGESHDRGGVPGRTDPAVREWSAPSLTAYGPGKSRRMGRLFPKDPVVWLPVDDSLMTGPVGGLGDMGKLLRDVGASLDALIAFQGTLARYWALLGGMATIENLTASTIEVAHTAKVLVASVEDAVRRGADAVAVHLNFTDSAQPEGIRAVGSVASDCDRLGIPLVVIVYPRRIREDGKDDNYEDLRAHEPDRYVELVSHGVRVAVELGADVVKTSYPGNPEALRSVVQAALERPVVVAGGPAQEGLSVEELARGCIAGGAAGVCFGRRVFGGSAPADTIAGIRRAIDVAGRSGR